MNLYEAQRSCLAKGERPVQLIKVSVTPSPEDDQ
jgi:hypothetical protein